LAALRAEKERLRAQKEIEAEQRSREAGRRAQEQQEREARERLRRAEEKKAQEEQEEMERLRRMKERVAQERSREALKRRQEQQEKEAKERLVQILVEERQDTIRKKWTAMREQAEIQHLQPMKINNPALNGNKSMPPALCIHPQVGWARKNGPAKCSFCDKRCEKYSFRCPNCQTSACMPCKKQRCIY